MVFYTPSRVLSNPKEGQKNQAKNVARQSCEKYLLTNLETVTKNKTARSKIHIQSNWIHSQE